MKGCSQNYCRRSVWRPRSTPTGSTSESRRIPRSKWLGDFDVGANPKFSPQPSHIGHRRPKSHLLIGLGPDSCRPAHTRSRLHHRAKPSAATSPLRGGSQGTARAESTARREIRRSDGGQLYRAMKADNDTDHRSVTCPGWRSPSARFNINKQAEHFTCSLPTGSVDRATGSIPTVFRRR